MSSPIEKQQQAALANSQPADQDYFLSLVDMYQRLIMKVCWAYTRSSHDRDDLFQEIVARLWAAFGNYDRNRLFSTWMYRVALNVAIDFRRRRRRRDGVTQSLDLTREPPSSQDEHRTEQLQELHELLEQQNDADRAILLLCLEGNSYREIAEVVGISETNVGTRLNRRKNSLRQTVQSSKT